MQPHTKLAVCGIVSSALVSGGAADAVRPDRPGDHDAVTHDAVTHDAVTHWSEIANGILPAEPGPILDARAFAILHAAIHDAVNSIERRYQPYTADLSSPGASLGAAVAAAARDVLVAHAPSHRTTIEKEYASGLGAVPDGPAKTAGVKLGQACAKANLDRRAGDGITAGPFPPREGPITQPPYVPNGRPGDYAFTPPFDQPPMGPIALLPGFGRLKPFAVDLANHRFRGPDDLRSPAYASDLNYLKSVGALHSKSRTPDQTAIALFWFEPLATWNQIAVAAIRHSDLDPWRAARVLALMSFAVVDAGIAVFDAKYRFRSWRPYTAIRRADEDGNPRTAPDREWLPLLSPNPHESPPRFFIPPIPEYPSAAAICSSAAAEVLIRTLGDKHDLQGSSETLPGTTRRWKSFSEAAHETRWSRVYGGIHFRHAIEDGRLQGESIGRTIARMLPPVAR
jgi:hypothetical protein